jgi:cyclomaltodextrinase
MIPIVNSADKVLTFAREKDGDKVLVVINFSDKKTELTMESNIQGGTYKDFTSGKEIKIAKTQKLEIEAWGYRVLSMKSDS